MKRKPLMLNPLIDVNQHYEVEVCEIYSFLIIPKFARFAQTGQPWRYSKIYLIARKSTIM